MKMPDIVYVKNDEYHHSRIVEALRKENDELKAKLDKAKSVLRFYAEESEHTSCEFDCNTEKEKYYPRDIFHDRGQRARNILEEI